MRKKRDTLQGKLKQYSLLVTPMIGVAVTSSAQIIYHDVNPDEFHKDSIAGDNYTNPFFLDLDGNGTYDIEFAVWSSVQSNNGPNKVNIAGARPFGANGNAIMGYTNLLSASFCSTPLPLYCPSALNIDKVIGTAANFWALPGSNSLGTLVRYFKSISPPNNFVGQWNNTSDKYVGLRFTGGDGLMHYGWIRLDVSKSPASITLKDYAFEKQNGKSIKAGDAGNVGVPSVNYSESFDVFTTEGAVNILIKDGKSDQATVDVINRLGQTVLSQPLHNSMTRIDAESFVEGIYVVSIHRSDESFSKKIFLR